LLFQDLLASLASLLRTLVRNGEFTERALSRRLGLSQSHLHHVLKGVKSLSPELADRILSRLGLSVLDLIPGDPPRKGPASDYILREEMKEETVESPVTETRM